MIKYIHRCNNPAVMNIWLQKGFGVEVDIWFDDGKLFGGHDYPEYLIDTSILCNELVLVHCKNIEALGYFQSRFGNKGIHYFFHDKDDATLTNWGLIVYHSRVDLGRPYRSTEIPVLPVGDLGNAFGAVLDILDEKITEQANAA